MSDRDLDLILHLRCLVAVVAGIGDATIDDAAALSATEIQDRIEFLRVEVERRLDAMRPPPPQAVRASPRAEPDDLPF